MNREAELFPMAADAAATSGDAPTRRGLANGTYTLVNRAKGTHRTLRIRTQKDDAKFAPGKRILALLEGPDNNADYRGFAFVDDEGVHVWRKHQGSVKQQLAEILWDLTEGTGDWHDRVEVRESRRCIRCNRTLTDPVSIELGIGPICRGES